MTLTFRPWCNLKLTLYVTIIIPQGSVCVSRPEIGSMIETRICQKGRSRSWVHGSVAHRWRVLRIAGKKCLLFGQYPKLFLSSTSYGTAELFSSAHKYEGSLLFCLANKDYQATFRHWQPPVCFLSKPSQAVASLDPTTERSYFLKLLQNRI